MNGDISIRKANRRTLGFTLVEMSLVLVSIGVIMSVGLPITRVYVEHSKLSEDRIRIQEIKDVLIGYAMTRGGFPDPDAGDILPSSGIGASVKNPYAMDVQYYVHASLTESATAQSFTTLCDNAVDILDGTIVDTDPAICNDVTDAYANCTDSTVMAFVIVSPGKNRVMEHENDDGDLEYENPAKKPNEPNDYDDVVASYGLPALINECQSI